MMRHTAMLYKTMVSLWFLAGVTLTGLGLMSLKHEIGWSRVIADKHWTQVAIDEGNLLLVHARSAEVRHPTKRWILFRGGFGVLGFRSGANGRWQWRSLTVPLWIVVGVLFIQPTIAFIRGPMRQHIRRRRNQCLQCGYDRQGNESGICPECGNSLVSSSLSNT